MHQQRLTAKEFTDLLPAPPTVSAEWRAFSLFVNQGPPRLTTAFSDHVVTSQVSGRCRHRQEVAGRVVEGHSEPGSVHVIPAHLQATWESAAPFRAIVLFVPEPFLSRVIAEYWDVDPKSVDIVPRFLARDPVIESMLTRMAHEAQNGAPAGQLYAASASEFLAVHLVTAHSSLSWPAPVYAGGLPGRRLQLVLEFIAEGFARPIGLHELARLANVSARHFERAFRQSMGVTVHAYVLSKRVGAARDLLVTQPCLTVAEIAERVGFSSASHLAFVFRRHTGQSPTSFRRETCR